MIAALIAGIPGADPPSARAIHPENRAGNGARAACQRFPDPPPRALRGAPALRSPIRRARRDLRALRTGDAEARSREAPARRHARAERRSVAPPPLPRFSQPGGAERGAGSGALFLSTPGLQRRCCSAAPLRGPAADHESAAPPLCSLAGPGPARMTSTMRPRAFASVFDCALASASPRPPGEQRAPTRPGFGHASCCAASSGPAARCLPVVRCC